MRATLVLCAALSAGGCATQPAAPAKELLETYWRAEQIDGRAIVQRPGTREMHIVLMREGGRMSGFAGCNGLSGSYQLDGSTLRFGDRFAMTRMACVGEGDALEAAFTKALGSAASYRIAGNQLELRDASGAVRMIFEGRAQN